LWNLLVIGHLWTHDLDAALTDALGRPLADLRDTARERAEAYVALERGEPRALELWSAINAKDDDPAFSKGHDAMLRGSGRWLALAKARFGDLPGARALIAQTPLDCRGCVQFRGRIAVLAGDPAEAEKWFAQAIELAPKLLQVYVDRGQARLDRGELASTLADATHAATLSPHYGDAWKLWGDVLAKQGNTKEALVKYDAALKFAPNWTQLKEAREAVSNPKS
jgi:tetratricopeptide (TPR) repeat protein